MRASARSFGKSTRHMDIVQLPAHHLRRARTHPLILSTMLPAEAMPPSGHTRILSKEPVASVAASASMSSPRMANEFLVLVMYGSSSSAGELISPMISFSSASAKMGSFSDITFSSASTEVGDARFLEERTGTRSASGTWVLGPTLGLLVSSVRDSWGSQLMGVARAPARLGLRLARLARLTHLVRVPE